MSALFQVLQACLLTRASEHRHSAGRDLRLRCAFVSREAYDDPNGQQHRDERQQDKKAEDEGGGKQGCDQEQQQVSEQGIFLFAYLVSLHKDG